jgi:hypothetical protein
VTQTARDRALRSSFSRLGAIEERRSFDGYQVQALRPHALRPAVPRVLPKDASRRSCQVGWANQEMLAVLVHRGQPVSLTFAPPAELAPAASVQLAIGFLNGDTVWPRKPVHARLVSAAASADMLVENLGGMQWHAWPASTLRDPGSVSLELTTDDELARLVCLELSFVGRPLP